MPGLQRSQCGHPDCSVDRFQAKSQSKRVAKRYAVVQTHSPTATSDGIETQGPRLDKECFYSYHGGFLKKMFWRLLISLFEGKFQEHATNRFRFSKSVTRLCIVSDFPRVFHSKTKLVRDSWEDCFYSYHARFLIQALNLPKIWGIRGSDGKEKHCDFVDSRFVGEICLDLIQKSTIFG